MPPATRLKTGWAAGLPDGEWLAFYRDGGPEDSDADDAASGSPANKSGIWLRNPDGVNLIQLTEGADTGPVWSPDGEHIAFVREVDGNQDVYLVSRVENGTWQDDARLTRLTQHPGRRPLPGLVAGG